MTAGQGCDRIEAAMELEIIQPYMNLIAIFPGGIPTHLPGVGPSGVAALRHIESIARVSHRAEDKQTEDSWKRFIYAVVRQKGDWSVVEHAAASVEAEVDRGITHEIVRHRLASYTQESTRFVNYEKKGTMRVIQPPGLTGVPLDMWRYSVEIAASRYEGMLTHPGITPQIARSVLPNALASKIVITANLRSWRWFFMMRTTMEAHPQMKEVAIPLLAEFREFIPLLFDDIEPNARQADNLRLPK